MGGSSKSSSSTTAQYDNRVGAEDSIVASNHSSIYMSDAGTVNAAFNFAGNVAEGFLTAVKSSNDSILNSSQKAIDAVSANSATLLSATKSEQAQLMDKLLTTTAICAIGYYAVKAFTK